MNSVPSADALPLAVDNPTLCRLALRRTRVYTAPNGDWMPKEDRTNDDWLKELRSSGLLRDVALADLRTILLAGLRRALSGWVKTHGRNFDALAEDFAQEALLLILNNLASFRGQSRFTTWAHKIAVRVALTELRRRRWKDVSLESLMDTGESRMPLESPARDSPGQEERPAFMDWLRRLMAEELTEKQRRAIAAVALGGMPLEEAARRMDTNRNALYKLLHDARLRLKRRLARDGVILQEMMEALRSG